MEAVPWDQPGATPSEDFAALVEQYMAATARVPTHVDCTEPVMLLLVGDQPPLERIEHLSGEVYRWRLPNHDLGLGIVHDRSLD